MFNKFVLLLTLTQIVINCNNDDPKVCLPQLGCLQGTTMAGYYSKPFEAFLGVPYAQPPVGDLRFHNPQPVQPWLGVLSTETAKSDCLQKNFLQPQWPITGSEDCLYLNIYRPSGGGTANLPVIFYIYGGGLFSGSAHPAVMGPEYFMDTGEVMVITVNYRLGPFGFLSSGDASMPGNYGLKDQFMALKWVNDHIAAFGGDPKEITLFGHSAGAACVHYHMLNSKTKDLFKRSILSSGNALAPFVDIQDKPLQQTHKIATKVGIENPQNLTTQDLTQQLRNIDAHTILEAGVSLKFWFNHILFNYRPVLEDPALVDAYIVEHPGETIRQGNFVMKPWLTGLVSYTGESAAVTLNIYDKQTLRSELNGNFHEIMYKLMGFSDKMGNGEKKQILNAFVAEYMQDIQELNAETEDGFQELFSDYYFYYPLYTSLRFYMQYADLDTNPVYIYKFSYRGPYTYVPVYTGGSTKHYDVVHFDDLLYQFRQSALFPDFDETSQDWELSKDFVKMLVDFAKTGHPLDYANIGSCAKDQFLSNNSGGICNYLEFINADRGYAKRSNNEFNVRRMHLWDTFFKSS